ncbi:hypothetical protein [Pelagicoccus sp. SDUM812003]|uniref:hypothetical protein n=1 Tax=Pelagicoccus sp. SDUM812003 TaxID=3041267 RepID=UPI00280C45F5|nr:hypothetical protein [Pelagicoccus sp. SDUM812003]MDQ8202125.1 hypothetical protein [Pelagicoccus sp. SDUM812003]
MNKSLATNLIALLLLIGGLLLPDGALKAFIVNAGTFALAGAVTNWLAVHMLFERVPGLYGSGVIAARFEQFKAAIHKLVMESFFTEENFMKFADTALHQSLDADAIEKNIDLDELFEGFLQVVAKSKFGGMLSMFGGVSALEPLREPFKEEFRRRIDQILQSLDISHSHSSFEKMRPTIETLVQGKLEELTAPQVKQILSDLIREHLGWLVVWGGVFGAAIGLLSTALQRLAL